MDLRRETSSTGSHSRSTCRTEFCTFHAGHVHAAPDRDEAMKNPTFQLTIVPHTHTGTTLNSHFLHEPGLASFLFYSFSVARWSSGRLLDLQSTGHGSNPSHPAVECNPGQVVNTNVSLSPSSIIWYQPMGGDALWLGR